MAKCELWKTWPNKNPQGFGGDQEYCPVEKDNKHCRGNDCKSSSEAIATYIRYITPRTPVTLSKVEPVLQIIKRSA